jgi:hypothetical protein
MNDTIAELQERLDDYTDVVLMEIIEDAEFGYLQDLRNLAEELDGMEER